MRTNGYRYARPFESDVEQETDADSAAAESASRDEPDYSFEGFSVEFLDKVALLPVTPASSPTGPGRR